MVDFYPEVKEKVPFIQKVVKTEEERFHETINEGLAILEEVISKEKSQGNTVISGKDAFKLYDTFGFPFELTQEYAEENNMEVDQDGFENEMKAQRERARAARQEVDSMQVQGGVLSDITVLSEFSGYDQLNGEAKILEVLQNGERVAMVSVGDEAQIILNKTPFYAESGGQIADEGTITGNGLQLRVKDVQKAPNGQNLHTVVVEQGVLESNMDVIVQVDETIRAKVVKNHTATHLLHQALKDVLGTHVNQAGSLVQGSRLRFDFTHFGSISPEELERIEEIVNEKVWSNIPVEKMVKNLQEAKAMGAMALFGEKYGETVRVVKVGDYSLELCGGCHVNNTAEIGLFKIVSESGIGAGTRRIEAVTGEAAYRLMNGQVQLLKDTASKLKTNVKEVPQRIDALNDQIRELQKEKESLASKLGNLEAGSLIDEVQTINGVSVIAKKVNASDMNGLRSIVDDLKNKIQSGIVILGSESQGKVNIVAGVTKDLVSKGYHAGNLVKEVAVRCGGGGGGRPDMAQAGGKDPEKLQEGIDSAVELIKTVS
jgi:alanyl-tRNA synthetase